MKLLEKIRESVPEFEPCDSSLYHVRVFYRPDPESENACFYDFVAPFSVLEDRVESHLEENEFGCIVELLDVVDSRFVGIQFGFRPGDFGDGTPFIDSLSEVK